MFADVLLWETETGGSKDTFKINRKSLAYTKESFSKHHSMYGFSSWEQSAYKVSGVCKIIPSPVRTENNKI
jgi:hypothetical protein